MAGLRRNHRAFLMLAIAAATGCGCNGDATGPEAGGACTGNVRVSVSAGKTPTFTWTPLVGGTTYEVILFRGTPETATIAAIKEFTPQAWA